MATEKKHSVILEDRKCLTIFAITDINGFDENTVKVSLKDTSLIINGSGLSVKDLSAEEGKVVISGTIDSLEYTDSSTKKGVFARIFG